MFINLGMGGVCLRSFEKSGALWGTFFVGNKNFMNRFLIFLVSWSVLFYFVLF